MIGQHYEHTKKIAAIIQEISRLEEEKSLILFLLLFLLFVCLFVCLFVFFYF